MSNLQNVKVGDKLIATSRWVTRIVTVEKVLKANIIAGGLKFRKADGYKSPIDAWNATQARPATDKDIEFIKEEKRRRDMASTIRRIDFDALTTAQLERIIEIVYDREEGGER